jgi:GAF domain-containing protein
MDKELLFKQVIEKIDETIDEDATPFRKVEMVMNLLKDSIPQYDWVGIYLYKDGFLKLGPYSGPPTSHTKINTDEGICGASYRKKETIIVPDVSADDRFIACSITTKSEIVVPIFLGDEVIGEIDIDSDTHNAFDRRDEEFLKSVIDLITPFVVEI